MDRLTLRYESEPKLYGFKMNCESHQERVDGLVVSEMFKFNPSYYSIQDGLGNHQVILEAKVEDKSELSQKYQMVSKFVKSLDRPWMYTCGHPLIKKHFSFMAPHIVSINGTLDGWSGTFDTVFGEQPELSILKQYMACCR